MSIGDSKEGSSTSRCDTDPDGRDGREKCGRLCRFGDHGPISITRSKQLSGGRKTGERRRGSCPTNLKGSNRASAQGEGGVTPNASPLENQNFRACENLGLRNESDQQRPELSIPSHGVCSPRARWMGPGVTGTPESVRLRSM